MSFDQALSSGTATQQALRVFSQQAGGRKAGTTAISGNTLTFGPGTAFKPGETVFATVTAAAQNSSGTQNLTKPFVFQFTAATAPAPGTFSGGADPTVGVNPQSVTLGDVDGDGDLDLLTASSLANSLNNGTVSVRLNIGAGAYSGFQQVAVGRSPYQVVLSDVDNDGDLDLLTANSSQSYSGNNGTVSVRVNDGSGAFSGDQEVAVGDNPHAIALGDVDGDGDLDLLAANYTVYDNSNASTVSVRFNDGSGLFGGTQSVLVGPRPVSLVLGDVDNDGDLDLATATSVGTTASVRLNNGQGVFSGTQEVGVGFNPESVVLGDVDNDGDLDLLTANYYDYTNTSGNYTSSTASVRLNNGAGTFSGSQNVPVGQGARSIALGDVDGDGDLDLLATNELRNVVGVRLNNRTGSFSVGPDVAVGATPASVALGDVDGDGKLDLVAANNAGTTVSVRLNQAAVSGVLGAALVGLAEQVSLYPNPAHATVRLLLPAGPTPQPARVQFVNILGAVVREQQVSAQAAITGVELSVRELPLGMYLVRVHTSQGIVVKRLVVE